MEPGIQSEGRSGRGGSGPNPRDVESAQAGDKWSQPEECNMYFGRTQIYSKLCCHANEVAQQEINPKSEATFLKDKTGPSHVEEPAPEAVKDVSTLERKRHMSR